MDLKKLLHGSLGAMAGGKVAGGFRGSAAALYLASLDEPLLAIAATEHEAEILRNDIVFYQRFFSSASVEFLPFPDDPHSVGVRTRILHSDSRVGKLVSFPESVSDPGMPPDTESIILKLKKGQEIERVELAKRLYDLGYREVSVVAQEGEYCSRNFIWDIFPAGEDNPVRVEFFGDEIDSIRHFRIENQRSIEVIDEMIFYPAASVGTDGTAPFIDQAAGERTLYEVEGGMSGSGWSGEITDLSFISGDGGPEVFHSVSGLGILPAERKSFESLPDSLRNRDENILIVVPHLYQAKRLSELFEKKDMPVPVLEFDGLESYPGRIAIATGSLSEGIFTDDLMILTQKELFDRELVLAKKTTGSGEKFLERYEDITAGDYVVHADHGIGRFRGLSRHVISGDEVEVALVEYAENSLLYVPLYHIDRIHKFRAEEGFVPSMDKLGGKTWNRKKVKVKRKIELMLEKLIGLYARREMAKGFSSSADSEMHREFYGFFPYQETDDQIRAIREIFADMESGTPMDRLLCGDVGFGKTEVAMRAAFKAVYDNRQVAVIVPTTILCEQHYRNFRERFAAFPVSIDFVSRFKSPARIRQALDLARKGETDILIGTSALLKRDIKFSNLGLLIIDEEHRFGVAQKEKIKEMKSGVDCLMMSATPIPRSLQMAMSGIRKMSVIETPPEERLAVRTVIARFEEELIRDAVHREVARGGQVFFVNNRIMEIGKLKEVLQKILPDIKIAVAHGQMHSKDLEDIMIGFMNHESDLLLSTNIIASGIDIPSANTIIVNRAERYGLADLYQLKGRVGRGSVKAFAYLLVNPGQLLTEQGKKRLKAIEQLSYLGAGLKLAMKDLEIRGAGTLFGYEQSGHMHEIGFDMYMDMMKKEIEKISGAAVEETPEPEMDISASALIPSGYIEDETVRFSLYRRMASIRSETDLQEFREEMEDRFGRVPDETDRLFGILSLKILAREMNVKRFSVSGSSFSISFRNDERISMEEMFGLARRYKGLKYRENGFDIFFGSKELPEKLIQVKEILLTLRK